MGENTTNIILTASERSLVEGLRRGEKAVAGYNTRVTAAFRKSGEIVNRLSERYLTRFSGVLSGTALALAGKGVIDFDSKLARLTIQAGKSGKDMLALKARLFEVAEATHQSPTELLEGVSAIVERTGNFKFAVDSLKSMGIVASATGARMADIGATASNLQEKMGITQDQVMTVFDILNEQGKKGSFTLQNMASLFERLLSAAGRFDVTGVSGMRQFGAFLQIARRGTGSSEQAATAVERTIADLISKADILKGGGINIFDPAKSKKAGRNVMRDFDAVLKEVIVKTKGDAMILGKIFGEESIRAVTPLAQSFKKFGDFREMDEFAKMGGTGATIMKDFAFWSEQTATKIGDFRTQLSKFANTNLAGPIDQLNKALSFLNGHPFFTSTALKALLGLGGVLVGARIFRGLREVKTTIDEIGAIGPIILKNRIGVGAWRNWGNNFGFAAKAALLTGAAVFGWEIGQQLAKLLGIDKGELGSKVYDVLHGGSIAQGKAGDTLLARAAAANRRGDYSEAKQILNQVKLILHIDKNGRVTTESSDPDTTIDVDRGSFLTD